MLRKNYFCILFSSSDTFDSGESCTEVILPSFEHIYKVELVKNYSLTSKTLILVLPNRTKLNVYLEFGLETFSEYVQKS